MNPAPTIERFRTGEAVTAVMFDLRSYSNARQPTHSHVLVSQRLIWAGHAVDRHSRGAK